MYNWCWFESPKTKTSIVAVPKLDRGKLFLFQETASSPKTRVCTLPSISEDDELSPSEDEEEDVKTMPVEKSCDDDEVESSIGGQSFNSPLLPAGRIFPKLPNGDVTMESVSR